MAVKIRLMRVGKKKQPTYRAKPTHPIRVAMATDGETLYVAARMWSASRADIDDALTQRDLWPVYVMGIHLLLALMIFLRIAYSSVISPVRRVGAPRRVAIVLEMFASTAS